MNYPFKKKHAPRLSGLLGLVLTVVMVSMVFAGCQKKVAEEPSTPPLTPPNLIESTEPTVPPTTTEPPTEPEKKNVAIVKENTKVYSAPVKTDDYLTELQAGEEVTINRVESPNGVQWAYIPLKGWVTTDNLDMSNVSGVISGNATPANPQATQPAATTATTPTGNSIVVNPTTGNGNNTQGKKGVVITNNLNVRSAAGTGSDIVGAMNFGTRVTILEESNGWGRTSQGWISLNYVYKDGTKGSNPCNGFITGTALNIRSGPGTNYDTVGSMSKGDRVSVLEQIKIGDTTWGCTSKGWISMDYVFVDGTVDEDTAGTGTVTSDGVNVRSGPGTNYEVVGTVNSGDEVRITSQVTVGKMTWGCTSKGWICMDYVGIG